MPSFEDEFRDNVNKEIREATRRMLSEYTQKVLQEAQRRLNEANLFCETCGEHPAYVAIDATPPLGLEQTEFIKAPNVRRFALEIDVKSACTHLTDKTDQILKDAISAVESRIPE